MPKTVTVVGATAAQGSSVVHSLLQKGGGQYSIRAVTRSPDSEAAKALAAKEGVTMVQADLDDLASLEKAFVGSYAIYAMTNIFEPFAKLRSPEKAMEIEYKQGVNLAKAASKTLGLHHYIWSTIPNAMRVSGGKYLIPHFAGKYKVDDFVRSDVALLKKTMFLRATFYATNFALPMFAPIHVPTAGKIPAAAKYGAERAHQDNWRPASQRGAFRRADLGTARNNHGLEIRVGGIRGGNVRRANARNVGQGSGQECAVCAGKRAGLQRHLAAAGGGNWRDDEVLGGV